MMELKQSTLVTFQSDIHKYYSTTDGHEVIGVTSLMKKHGLSPNYSGASKFNLKYAANRGSALHALLEQYDNKKKSKKIDIVSLMKGSEKASLFDDEGNIISPVYTEEKGELIPMYDDNGKMLTKVMLPVSDVEIILKSYISLGLKIQASEFLICDDTETVASSIDKVGKFNKDGSLDIYDLKFTSSVHQDALESQLSIYAFILEQMHPGLKVRNLYCIWGDLEKKECTVIPVKRIQPDWVFGLIAMEQAELIWDSPKEYTEESKKLDKLPDDIAQLTAELAEKYAAKQKATAEYEETYSKLLEVVEQKGWTNPWKDSNELIQLSYTKAYSSVSFDSTKFLNDHPEFNTESYQKTKNTKSSIKVSFNKK